MSRALVSADDVRRARERRETRLAVPSGAIVTPLARDEAARWGIELVEGTAADAGGARPSGAHAPTCDPGDVERVVRRVLTKVPAADPAQVREIARRALEQVGR